ncbi:FAD-dependent oxidoreductase [Rhizobium leguminosarum]|uniref:FAD-dependent oxidoreductase n=2 Tax=Rhizobium leguminosarum TaxID=384 RepID=UPI0010387CD8|nr:FAD-dependent oxidoreductase [Rhizobium leguminosarum]NKK46891.1 FAD-dependent oxidoreductase [Rhizobium leguminosarum bv. viciae]TBZ40460.1 FAD-dependent oxidoreductase [Rhizobium leguminosarum bv. viciae]TCA06436.1 FAD-dependent oxidoreductase [Rhizobium leguminosarum bv. viciae]TCA19644.1 FAD-dependent oxidoreductase [Rhizobium leguminosarum bv. viciae]
MYNSPFPHWMIENRSAVNVDLPVLAEVDVLVVGGGAAGVAAATTASEQGRSVILLERYGFCGGAAVAGMSGTICGLYLARDTPHHPEQVVFGFTERFRSELVRRGGLTEPQIYGKTFTVTHDPLMWRETADFFLEAAGVKILYHTVVTGVLMDEDTITGVVAESNAGRSVIKAKRVIDASGDAAVVARAGYRYTFGDHGRIQNPTMFFRLGNVDLDAFSAYWGEDTISPPKISDAIKAAHESGRYELPRNKIWIFPTTRPNELMVNATRLSGRDGRMLNVIDPADFTEAELVGRFQVREYARFLADHVPGCASSFVVDTGVEAGIRQTRSIAGKQTLSNDDVVSGRKRSDGICRVPWPIELHSGDKPKLHWLLDDFYEVPYGALVPERGENLIVAGRSLSAEHEALASARVTAQCFEYGHAAATAALISLEQARQFADIDGEEVREQMKGRGSAL